MATSLGVLIVLGLLANYIFTKLKLPGLLGMLLLGMMVGPYGLNIIHEDLLRVSGDFRQIALIIILLRAGLGISRQHLNEVGFKAIKLGTLPGLIEGAFLMLAAMQLFSLPVLEAGILAFIIAAVSPAVVVPLMLNFTEQGLGKNKSIPTMILAGASLDDVFAITIFTTFLSLYTGSHIALAKVILSVPLAILLGIVFGLIIGMILLWLFKRYEIRDTKKVLLVIGAGILLTALENLLSSYVEIAGLLGVMAIGFLVLERAPKVAKAMSEKLGKIWIFAEILLFVLVGMQVNVAVAIDGGLLGILLIGIGLVGRSLGVMLSLWRSNLTMKERLFCAISYVPKATVQAAIGAIPLSFGVPSGELILALAVLSIMVTAPLGAIGITQTAERFLEKS